MCSGTEHNLKTCGELMCSGTEHNLKTCGELMCSGTEHNLKICGELMCSGTEHIVCSTSRACRVKRHSFKHHLIMESCRTSVDVYKYKLHKIH